MLNLHNLYPLAVNIGMRHELMLNVHNVCPLVMSL